MEGHTKTRQSSRWGAVRFQLISSQAETVALPSPDHYNNIFIKKPPPGARLGLAPGSSRSLAEEASRCGFALKFVRTVVAKEFVCGCFGGMSMYRVKEIKSAVNNQ